MGRGNSDWVGKSPEAKQKAGRGGDELRVGCAELAERWVWGGRGHPVTEKSGLDLSGREGKARGGKGGEEGEAVFLHFNSAFAHRAPSGL